MLDVITSWIMTAVLFGTVIMLGSLGETMNEKAGHLNLGIPGIMYASGFIAYYATYSYEKSTSHPNVFLVLLISIIVALLSGALFGLIYSFMTVSIKCNQNVMGLLIASFGVGFGKFLTYVTGITGGQTNTKAAFAGKVYNASIPGLNKIPFIGKVIFGYGFIVYLTIIIAVLLTLFLNKTKYGLNLKAVGESPATADAVGINVNRYKYLTTIFGCSLAGLAGITYVLLYGEGLWSTTNNIEALGWLAVALVIFASWKPARLIWGSYLFGFLYWAYNYLPTLTQGSAINSWFAGANAELIKMLPYVITIIVLIINSVKNNKENQPPHSLGVNYFREER